MRIYLLLLILQLIFSKYPVALFHGLGDSCDNPVNIKTLELVSMFLDDIYVKCIETGAGYKTYTTSFKEQAEAACEAIKSNPSFQGDFSVIGISHGALLARYIVEVCDMKGTVKRYVSIGGTEMGVAKLPNCGEDKILCSLFEKIFNKKIFTPFIQDRVGPAGYFKIIRYYSDYLKNSNFLANLNNERYKKNESYKTRMLMLEKLLLIKFSKDTILVPKETAWFEFYGYDGKIKPLEKSKFYIDDYIGIKKLNEQGKINFLELYGQHLNFNNGHVIVKVIPALK
jgi:palmitoyl-protein thioesterase